MKTDIKKVKVFAPKWWNPLFWLLVVVAPILGILLGTIAGAAYGMLIGYEKGLNTANRKMHHINATLS